MVQKRNLPSQYMDRRKAVIMKPAPIVGEVKGDNQCRRIPQQLLLVLLLLSIVVCCSKCPSAQASSRPGRSDPGQFRLHPAQGSVPGIPQPRGGGNGC